LLKDLVKLQKQYDLETGKIVDKMRKEAKI